MPTLPLPWQLQLLFFGTSRRAVFCCGHLSFRLSYGLCKYGVREKHWAVAYLLLIFFPTNAHVTSWAHWLGAPKPSPHSLCCVSMTIMKPLVFNEFHFLSQLKASGPFSNHPKSKTPGALFPIAPWATAFLALSTQTGDCNTSNS